MKGVVLCEFSGVVSSAFRNAGLECWSCDILPTEGDPAWHIQDDAKKVAYEMPWDFAIMHPPCTFLANSGVRHLHSVPSRNGTLAKIHGEDRWWELHTSAKFFKDLLVSPIEFICIENPIPHRYAIEVIGRKYDQLIQPWQFGHGETKATCFWLKNLPFLIPTNIVEGREARIHRMPPGPDRAKKRSITFSGIARAMAEQWGAFLKGGYDL